MESPSVAVIVGDSPSLIEDTFNFESYQCYDYTVIAVNNGGFKWMDLTCTVPDYWYSYHEEWFEKTPVPFESEWLSCKQESYQELKPRYKAWDNITFLDIPTAHGSSGFHAANIAIDYLCANRVVLLGVELALTYEKVYSHIWKQARPKFKKHVRSMSGWTRTHFGVPTYAWLQGE